MLLADSDVADWKEPTGSMGIFKELSRISPGNKKARSEMSGPVEEEGVIWRWS
jgi:hypothetical protein